MAATCPPWVPRRRSQGPLLHLVRDVIARPHRQRGDGPGGFLGGRRHDRPAVRYKRFLAVVPRPPAVQPRRPGVVPHARPAELVDDGPAGREPVSLFGGRHRREHLARSEEHTSELQSPCNLVCRLLLEKKKTTKIILPKFTNY